MKMSCVGLYFTRQEILDQLSTLLHYFNNQVHSTLTHPLGTMNEEDTNVFLKGTLQINLEFWNSRKPLVEYIPIVPKPQDTLEVQIYSHIKKFGHFSNTSNQLNIFRVSIIVILWKYLIS